MGKAWFPFRPHVSIVEYEKRTLESLRHTLAREGILVVKNVLDAATCLALKQDMVEWLRIRNVEVNNPVTWKSYNNDYFEMSSSILGMMNSGDICESACVQNAKSSPRLKQLFCDIYEVPVSELVMERGGVFWGFPPEHYPGGRIPTDPTGGYAHWSDMWMHSDRGRNTVMPSTLLTTVILENVEFQDHGFVYLSNSHVYHDEFFASHPKGSLDLESCLEETDYVQLTFEDVKYFEGKGCQWRKVVAPKGSVIVWDTRLIHSTCSPLKGRPRPKPRFVIYGGYKPVGT